MSERPKNEDGTTPRPWQTMNNGRSKLIHVETAAENPRGAGVPVCSLPKALEPDAELICRAVNDADLLRAQRDELLRLLLTCRARNIDGEPCWCHISPAVSSSKEHASHCLTKRAAIARAKEGR